MKETEDLDYSNRLMQVSLNYYWKLLGLVANDWEGNDPSAPELLPLDICGTQMVRNVDNTGQKFTDFS